LRFFCYLCGIGAFDRRHVLPDQTQFRRRSSAGGNRKPVMRRDLRTGLVGIDGMLLTLDDVIIDAVFHIGTGVGIFRKEPLVVGFVFGKEQRRFTLAVQQVFAQR